MGTVIMVSAFINQGKVNTFLMKIICSYQQLSYKDHKF